MCSLYSYAVICGRYGRVLKASKYLWCLSQAYNQSAVLVRRCTRFLTRTPREKLNFTQLHYEIDIIASNWLGPIKYLRGKVYIKCMRQAVSDNI